MKINDTKNNRQTLREYVKSSFFHSIMGWLIRDAKGNLYWTYEAQGQSYRILGEGETLVDSFGQRWDDYPSAKETIKGRIAALGIEWVK